MSQLKKGFIAMCMALVLCVNFALPVNAAGTTCPSCGVTDTEDLSDASAVEEVSELCIHGHNGSYDRVSYLAYYRRIYCNRCKTEKILYRRYRQEMSRMCPWA